MFNKPADVPNVWSVEGPVLTEAVAPLALVQSKSSFVGSFVQPHNLLFSNEQYSKGGHKPFVILKSSSAISPAYDTPRTASNRI